MHGISLFHYNLWVFNNNCKMSSSLLKYIQHTSNCCLRTCIYRCFNHTWFFNWKFSQSLWVITVNLKSNQRPNNEDPYNECFIMSIVYRDTAITFLFDKLYHSIVNDSVNWKRKHSFNRSNQLINSLLPKIKRTFNNVCLHFRESHIFRHIYFKFL